MTVPIAPPDTRKQRMSKKSGGGEEGGEIYSTVMLTSVQSRKRRHDSAELCENIINKRKKIMADGI